MGRGVLPGWTSAAIFGEPGITFVDAATGEVKRKVEWPQEPIAFSLANDHRLVAIVDPGGASLTFSDRKHNGRFAASRLDPGTASSTSGSPPTEGIS